MKLILIVAAAASVLLAPLQAMNKPSAHTQGTPTGKPTGPMKPGEYWWKPQLSPNGPLMILVSVPEQVMHVYRNGVLIGRSTVSSGAKGHATPGGVFTILEKKKDHYSKKYDNAPMPNMQRLTWSGIAMHSGNLPGVPASHGCIRLPYDFSKLLFDETAKGGTVVIGDGKTPTPHLASNPGLMLAPKDFSAEMLRELKDDEYDWRPERSPTGPTTIVISGADKAMYIYRNGEPIGRASLVITGRGPLGNHVFSMLEGTTGKPSWFTPGKTGRRWLKVASDDASRRIDADELSKRLNFNPGLAEKLYDAVSPGTTVIVTDQSAARKPSKQVAVIGN